jgi:hypothetical protein
MVKKIYAMKTKYYLKTSTLIVICFLMISSCKKDVETKMNKENLSYIENSHSSNIVKNFIQQAQQVKIGRILKDSEKLPIEEAIDFIDESFSYEYCYHQANIKDIKTITISIKIPIIALEEKVYLVNALAAYNEAVDKVRVKYNDASDSKKVLYGVSVINKGIDNSGDYIDVDIIGKVGIGNIIASSSDGWYWAQQSHSCDEIILGTGAPEVIESEVTFGLNPVPSPNTRIWFTDEPETPIIESYANQAKYRAQNPLDKFCDYFIYYAEGDNLDPTVLCLEEDNGELSFYIQSASSVFNILISENPQYAGYSCKNLQVTDKEGSIPIHYRSHAYNFYIGIKHVTITTPVDPYPKDISIDE